MKKPLIGITLDEEEKKTYSKYPWFASRKNYSESIEKAGGICIFLPSNLKAVDYYTDLIDGLLITGGDFDIDPKLYGEKTKSNKVTTKNHRTVFEFEITRKAYKKQKSILGICGGQQLLNVVMGGTLIQHIPDLKKKSIIKHEQLNPRNQPSHNILIQNNTKLFEITKMTNMYVNSAHHQAVEKLGKNLIVNAFAEDGIIEGIESTDHKFCLGIQWHPEFLIDKGDLKIFKSFIKNSKK